MIKCLIFSKDRPMQLDAALRSFYLHCRDAKSATLVVLFLSTSEISRISYRQLADAYPEIQFVEQQEFRRDVIRLLNPFQSGSIANFRYFLLSLFGIQGFHPVGRLLFQLRNQLDWIFYWLAKIIFPGDNATSQTLFLVDDNIFFREFSLQPAVNALLANPNALGFSFRLGRNTTFNYVYAKSQRLPDFESIHENLLKYRWTSAELDFAYPLEVSSSLYLDKIILPLLLISSFQNPNELEAALTWRTRYARKTLFELVCFPQSVTFCNPINVVQSAFNNRSAETVSHSIDELLDRFMSGERIDIEKFNRFIPESCHQEAALHFTKIQDQYEREMAKPDEI